MESPLTASIIHSIPNYILTDFVFGCGYREMNHANIVTGYINNWCREQKSLWYAENDLTNDFDAFKIVVKAGGVDSNLDFPEHCQTGMSTVRKMGSDEVIPESLTSNSSV